MKFKIFLALGFAFCITLGMLFSLMDLYINIYDPEWNGIFSNDKMKNDDEIIFLIGASNVYSIDVDKISKKISSNGFDYGIYNLADMSDTPTKRMNSIGNLLNLEPDIVIYGLSITDFELDRDYKSEVFNNDFSYYLLNPDEFFRHFFSYMIDSDFSEKFPTSPKDRMMQSIKYVLRGPDYPTHPFINFKQSNIISQDEMNSIYQNSIEFRGIDDSIENDEFIAANKIIETFESNGIKVLIFTPPYNELVFQHVEQNEREHFVEIMEKISEKFEIDVLYLHEKYAEEEIWKDPYHVAVNENTQIYTNDIKNWLIVELKE